MSSTEISYWAGIGSREAVHFPEVMQLCREIGQLASSRGFQMRSGGAPGCDTAFHEGAGRGSEVWLPFDGFNDNHVRPGSDFRLLTRAQSEQAEKITLRFHPKPKPKDNWRWWALMNRNACQILGENLIRAPRHERVEFVACWTTDGRDSGGTGQAIRIARDSHIPVYNVFHKGQLDALIKRIEFDF